MPFIDASDLAPKEPLPGWVGRFFHSAHMTFAYYEIAPGSRVHRHHHPNEEVWHVIEGELEMVLGDDQRVLRAGQAAVVPAGVEHSTSTTTHCRAIVVDFPIREQLGGVALD